jgi:hypothetical protein
MELRYEAPPAEYSAFAWFLALVLGALLWFGVYRILDPAANDSHCDPIHDVCWDLIRD